jgi:two-component system, chemotaxis family, protein-glutamate methylesterase/glutaminase
MSIAVAAASPAASADRPIRVMVVDDAVVARSLLRGWIDAEPDMKIVAALRTGRQAVDAIEHHDADVVMLDVDMPELDGISALPLLLKKKRGLVVIMVSTLTRRSAEVSLRALSLGAADYVPKPEAAPDAATSVAFRRELIEKVRTLGRGRSALRALAPAAVPAADPSLRRALRPSGGLPLAAGTSTVNLRPFSLAAPRALLIGSSTGGPQALSALLATLTAAIDRAPVLIAQHMPPTFTAVLAEHLKDAAGRDAHEGEDGEPVLAGGIYVAPGGRHMRVVRGPGGVRIALGDDPPINFCKPAVDALFSSAAAAWGAGNLALVLTGMGTDGTRGAADLVAAGGSVIAQDEATSVVWGMPRSAAQAGLCSAVLPLDQMAANVTRLFFGDRQ